MPAGTYRLFVRAIGLQPSDSITATVVAGRTTEITIRLADLSDPHPVPIDSARMSACARRAYAGSPPPSDRDSLLLAAFCSAVALMPGVLGDTLGYCVAWGPEFESLLHRFKWMTHPLVLWTMLFAQSALAVWLWRRLSPRWPVMLAGLVGVWYTAGTLLVGSMAVSGAWL